MDNEVPALISEEQMDRYVETVAELLRAAGLEVDGPHGGDPAHIEARKPGGTLELDIDIRDDRSADWSISGGDELMEGTKALELASFLARLLDMDPQSTDG